MLIDRRITRNSGATLEPAVYKHGPGCRVQAEKMVEHPAVFVPVLAITDEGYFLPLMEQSNQYSLPIALRRLAFLWKTQTDGQNSVSRWMHHIGQVEPLTNELPSLDKALQKWYARTVDLQGRHVYVAHGDPTLENIVQDGWWLDPSTRPLPLEAELDGGKLLQSYFGYHGLLSPLQERQIVQFLHDQNLNIDLCVYYLVTHIVRLYKVQPWARAWADDLLATLDGKVIQLCR